MDKKNFAKLATGSLLGAVLVCGNALLLNTNNADAAVWSANTPDSIQITKGQKTYTVKYGDTLWAISIKTNIKVDTLAQASGIDNPNDIQIGQKIVLKGNKLVVKDSSGEVVGSTTLNDSDKVVENQSFGTAVTTPTPSSASTSNSIASQANTVTTVSTESTQQVAPSVPTANVPVTPSKPDSGTTTPTTPSGSTPTTPDQGTTTPSTPDQGTTTPTTPDQGTTTPSTPDQGTTTPSTPDEGTTTPTTPDEGTTTPSTPDEGTTTPSTPDQGTTTPSTPDNSYLIDPADPNSFMTNEGIAKARSIAEAQINEIRAKAGLEAVDFSNEILQNAANKRAEQVAESFNTTDYYDNHAGFDGVMAEAKEQLKEQNLNLYYSGECESMAVIKYSQNSPEKVGKDSIVLLTKDKAHYDILTDNAFSHAAVGIAKATTKKWGNIYVVIVDFAHLLDLD
ncbi:LysM peptidoglycan-binding domain-containing protein [Limosilactobacillus mucosae]|uniref:LysM peptidoglycan-binding domain-containing protein n=1 Tax=Limosilactobacillus mucosae TaxID=97478 RepID=A0AAJ1HSJ9_LIMMU|nr:LysM peptidoglycan-binding domain-containing protein [Limosilactobacillus mucosae]MDC2828456.1 LysM peptidoglycan-binding domain-containing protein [Limosilactobacillus mucosae]